MVAKNEKRRLTPDAFRLPFSAFYAILWILKEEKESKGLFHVKKPKNFADAIALFMISFVITCCVLAVLLTLVAFVLIIVRR